MNREFVMEKAHTEYADHIAYARLTDAVRTGRDYVGHVEGDDKLWSYVRGCRAEMAFYLWLGGKSVARWIDFIVDPTAEQLNFCDMVYRDFKIDVKARPEGWVDFIVRCKGVKPENVYVLAVTDFYPLIIFHGWMTGEEVARCRIGGRQAVPGYVIDFDDPNIKDCIEIKGIKIKIVIDAAKATPDTIEQIARLLDDAR